MPDHDLRPPSPPRPAPGHHWRVAESSGWRLVTGKQCRANAGYQRPACKAPSVAELNRSGRGNNWWAYCADHLYDNWIEDGRVVHWRLVEEDFDE